MKKDLNILNELRELSPLMFQMKQRGGNPFRVPDNYFPELRDAVFRHIDSGLADQKGTASFSVPDGYFENLTAEIMSKVESEARSGGGQVVRLQHNRRREAIPMRRWTTMAASVLLFITLGVLAAKFLNTGRAEEEPVAVNEDEAFEYIEERLGMMGALQSDDLIALMDESDELLLELSDDLESEYEDYLEEHIEYLDNYLLTEEI